MPLWALGYSEPNVAFHPALAAVTCFRSIMGFAFPLFAPYMYESLGFGKGNTILALFSLLIEVIVHLASGLAKLMIGTMLHA